MRDEFNKKIYEALDGVKKDQDKYTYQKQFFISNEGIKKEILYEKAQKLFELDKQKVIFGKTSGAKYYEENELNKEIKQFSQQFLYHNLLHFDMYVSIRQLEAELIAQTNQLFHGDPQNSYGVVTQGGTESICMAILAARNYCQKQKGINNPELIAASTVHTSVDKACSMFKIKLRKIEVNQKTFQIDLKKMKRAINSNTIMLIGSCPNYPHGIIDPLEEMAAIAKQKNILFHVDCCLGSLNLPFAIELGQRLPKFDFELDGVTSISIDHHKHGLAPKGVSMVLYKTGELRHSQYFTTLEWSGGMYGTASSQQLHNYNVQQVAGSRSGAPTAGAWFAMMYLGKKGYRDFALKIFNALNFIKKEISSIPELELLGDPVVNTLAFKSKNEKELPIYSIKKVLTENGWSLTGLQKPCGIHISLTQSFCKSAELFIKDLKNSINEVKANPEKYATNVEAEVYGTTQSLPVGKISQFADLLNGIIDISLQI